MADGGVDHGDALAERERAWEKANRKHRRRLRRQRRWRRYRPVVQAFVIVAGVGVVAVAAGLSGQGPLASLAAPKAPLHEELVSDVASTPSSSTSTSLLLERRSFHVGDCVVWDEVVQNATANVTSVVSCEEPHLMEVIGSFSMPKGPYPSEATWSAVFDTGRCVELGATYVGGALDPEGMYGTRGIIPTLEGWSQGDREVWCGLRRYPLEDAAAQARVQQYTGKIDPSAQHRTYPVGSCLGPQGEGLTAGTVPCDGPHVVEVVGQVDLSGRVQAMPTEDQYDDLVGDACQRMAKAYAGANLRAPVHAGWLDISQASWDTGRRVVTCTVAEYRNQDSLTITRRLGAPPA